MGGKLLKTVEQHAYLGIQIGHCLSWYPQVDYVSVWKSNKLKIAWFFETPSTKLS